MGEDPIITLCRTLIGLLETPEPGLTMWHVACTRTARSLGQQLAEANGDVYLSNARAVPVTAVTFPVTHAE